MEEAKRKRIKREKREMSIDAKSFVTAIIVIGALMVVTYILTFFVPGGAYDRIEDANGNLIIDKNSFRTVEGGIPFWKWLLSPFLVLGSESSVTIVAIIVFLLVIGGIFTCLEKSGMMKYMLDKIVHKFGSSKYTLMIVIMLFFMLMGAMVGSFEECVPFVPIVVALAVRLGWNKITGLAMSLLAAGCGFAAGVCNPFTVGVAQTLAGLPMFSGVWLRIVAFVLIFGLLLLFVIPYAKRVEKKNAMLATQEEEEEDEQEQEEQFVPEKRKDNALIAFVSIIGVGILTVLSSAFIPAIQSLNMIIVAVMFLVAGVTSCFLFGIDKKVFFTTFGKGVLNILPAVIMILMASSIRYTLDTSHILDTILHAAVKLADGMPKWAIILYVYAFVLVINFFVPSGSAKAFMLIPIIVPLAQMFDVSAQLCVLAFAFGDGFSNVIYPTDPVFLVSLGAADVSYGEWFKWGWKFQLANLVLTCGILLLGFAVGYC